jgi:putative transcriptional regulator
MRKLIEDSPKKMFDWAKAWAFAFGKKNNELVSAQVEIEQLKRKIKDLETSKMIVASNVNKIKLLRAKLGLTQKAMACGLGCSQGNLSHYESRNQTVPPYMADRMIAFAQTKGIRIGFDDIYGTTKTKTPK